MFDGPRRLIVVLGMHRSGTSVLARGLQVLGVELGQRLMPTAPDNPRAFWEDLDVVSINERVLAALSTDWRSPTLIDDSRWHSAALEPLASEAEHLLKSRLAQYRRWGFKDPRLCLTLPFWQPVFQRLGLLEGYVIALRNPRAVADSLRTHDQILSEQSYLMWLEHLSPALLDTSGKRRVLIDYDEMLRKPREQLCRIAKELELSPPAADNPALRSYEREFLDFELRHHEHSSEISPSDSHLAKLALKAFGSLRADALEQTARDDTDLRALANAVQAELESFAHILPLVHQLDRGVQALEKEMVAAREQFEREQVALRLENQHLVTSSESLRAENTALDRELAALRFENQRLIVSVDSSRTEIAVFLRELADARSALSEQARLNRELIERVSRVEAERDEVRAQAAQTSASLDFPSVQNHALKTARQSLNAALESQQAEIESLRAQIASLNAANQLQKAEIESLNENGQALRVEIGTLNEESEALRVENQSRQPEIESLLDRLKR